jgi:hypothetical protein
VGQGRWPPRKGMRPATTGIELFGAETTDLSNLAYGASRGRRGYRAT